MKRLLGISSGKLLSLELNLLGFLIPVFHCLWATLQSKLSGIGDDADVPPLSTMWWRDNSHPMAFKSFHSKPVLHKLWVHANIPAYRSVCSSHFPLNRLWHLTVPSINQWAQDAVCHPLIACLPESHDSVLGQHHALTLPWLPFSCCIGLGSSRRLCHRWGQCLLPSSFRDFIVELSPGENGSSSLKNHGHPHVCWRPSYTAHCLLCRIPWEIHDHPHGKQGTGSHPHSRDKWQSHLSTLRTVDCKPRSLVKETPVSLLHRKRNVMRAGSKMVLGDSLSLLFVSSWFPLPLYLGRTWDMLLTNRIDKGAWKMLLGLLYTTLQLLSSTLTLFLAGFDEASCWFFSPSPLWRGPCGKETEQASSQEPARTWGPQSICPQTCEVGNGSFPSQAIKWDHSPGGPSWPTLRQRTQSSYAQISNPQRLWDNVCCFQTLSLG